MRKTIITFIAVVAIVAAVYFGYQQYQSAQAAASNNYQTTRLTTGELTATVGATGTVRANQSAVIAWQLNGQVADVNVSVGDLVVAGQELTELRESSLPQSIILARADLIEARRSLERLTTSDVSRAQANQNLVLALKELEDAEKKRQSKNYDRATSATIDEARASLVIAEDAVKRATELYDRVDDRPEDDPIRAEAFSQLAAARRNRDRTLANLNYLLGSPNDLEVAEADARLELAQANLVEAEREFQRLKDGADPRDIEAAESRIAALEATLEQVSLESPFDGTVTEVHIQPGDQASPGMAAFRIDDLSRLLVDVQITEVDINRIRVGQAVVMTFDAIANKEYNGDVIEVGRVGLINQGVVNFNVTIELSDADGAVRPGMTTGVSVITEQLENVLVIPNRAVRLRDGQRIVYVLRDGLPVALEIELGLTSETQSELVGGGLREGDEIILNPPTQQFQPGGFGR
jgi:HlyD family secretion protein